jgi:hypothetical protein
MQPLEGGAGVDAQLAGQPATGSGVLGQRVRGAPDLVQGLHVQLDQPLAGRVLGGQPGEFGEQLAVAVQGEAGTHGQLHRAQAQLLQVAAQPLAQMVGRGVQQGRGAPQSQRLTEYRVPPPQVAGPGRPLDEGPEPLRVNGFRRYGQPVPVVYRLESHPAPEQDRSQTRDVCVHRAPGPRRRAALPQQVDQPLDRYRAAVGEQQYGEHEPLPAPLEGHHTTVRRLRLDRAEHPEPHAATVRPSGRRTSNG